MRINKWLFLFFGGWITFFGCTSVLVSAEPSWQEIVESDHQIWDRRIEDENLIKSTRRNYNRIVDNVARINQIAQETLQKLQNKDCVASAMAIERLTGELQYYPRDREAIQGAIEQIQIESRQKCPF